MPAYAAISANSLLNALPQRLCVFSMEGLVIQYNRAFGDAYAKNGESLTNRHYRDIPSKDYQAVSCVREVQKNKKPVVRQVAHGLNGMLHMHAAYVHEPDGREYIIESLYPQAAASAHSAAPEPSPRDMILSDTAMQPLLNTVQRIGHFDSTVLITGESGTGKSMLAKYIHASSKRAGGPFITINCATIPETLIESELFGYASGAFTGASQKGKPGMVALADGGTLFLDEVGLLPFNLQAKFLQLIQDKVYTPVGALKSNTVDVRIISATNLDLKEQVLKNRFREDLYYRLRVIEFHMPPLRERPDAVEPLIVHFLHLYNERHGVRKDMSPSARELLKKHVWSGNIRELQYMIERLVVTSASDMISSAEIPPMQSAVEKGGENADVADFEQAVEHYEKTLLTQSFLQHKSSYKVAVALGISQTKASRLLRKYGIR